MTGDTLPTQLDLLRLFFLQPRPNHISVGGNVQVVDAPEPRPITFTSGRASVRVSAPWNASDGGKFEFYFRTVQPTGLMLYSGPGSDGGSVSVELFDGRVYINVDDGSRRGVHKYVLDARSGRVDDGQPHRVTVELENSVVWMELDGVERVERLSRQVDLRGAHVYLGGVDDGVRLPWHLWTRVGPSYRGCLWSVRFNGGRMVDLVGLVTDAGLLGGIEIGCRTMPSDCTPDTCRNDGVCSQMWDAGVCDCSRTAFTGTHCEQGSLFMYQMLCLALSAPIPLRLYTLPYSSNPPILIIDIRALWRSVLSARAPKCQKLKMVG